MYTLNDAMATMWTTYLHNSDYLFAENHNINLEELLLIYKKNLHSIFDKFLNKNVFLNFLNEKIKKFHLKNNKKPFAVCARRVILFAHLPEKEYD